jgi:hypothetical protein
MFENESGRNLRLYYINYQIVNLPGVNPASSTATSVKCPPARRRRTWADCVAVIMVVTTTLASLMGAHKISAKFADQLHEISRQTKEK